MSTSDKNSAETVPPIGVHGSDQLPGVTITSYNLEVKDKDGFIGDKASGRAFRSFVRDWRVTLRELGKDPFSEDLDAPVSKKKLDKFLAAGDPDAAAVVQGAIEDFANNLAFVVKRYLAQKSWREVKKIVVGGGLSMARVGELAVARANALLRADEVEIDLHTIRHHPDEAGLLGCLHLAPAWIFSGYSGIIAIDIGGSNIRCGVVRYDTKKDPELKHTTVSALDLWRHADEEKLSREEAVKRLVSMIQTLVTKAESEKLSIAPFIGLACPGIINPDGSIKRGAQNLPGNWEAASFRLPERLREAIPQIGDHETMVMMHNDAVIQGLSERPWMTDVEDWAVLTVGTGLGNASFRTRSSASST
jgi:predicted NBD/HSP70 family sugar kinase